jgi:hypothetical protein
MPLDPRTQHPALKGGKPRPLRVTRRDDELGCDVRRVVGYVGTCPDCGEKMPTCSTVRIARLALEMHQLHRHGT